MKDILKADIRDRAEIDLEALFRGPIGFETDKPGRIQLLNSQGPAREIAFRVLGRSKTHIGSGSR